MMNRGNLGGVGGVVAVIVFALIRASFRAQLHSHHASDHSSPARVSTAKVRASALPFFNRGVDALNAQDYDTAIDWFSKAIQLEPQDAPSRLHRGIAYDAKQDYDKAI